MAVTHSSQYENMLRRLLHFYKQDERSFLSFTIEELEQAVIGAGFDPPIVRLPEHFHYRNELFPHLNPPLRQMCKCTAEWPCLTDLEGEEYGSSTQ